MKLEEEEEERQAMEAKGSDREVTGRPLFQENKERKFTGRRWRRRRGVGERQAGRGGGRRDGASLNMALRRGGEEK